MKYDFEKVVPTYMGGGYVSLVGKANGFYFSVSTMAPEVMEIDECPFDENGQIKNEIWEADYYENHWTEALVDGDEFYLQLLAWVKDNIDPKLLEENHFDIDRESEDFFNYLLHR